MSIPDLLTVACSTLENPDISPALKAAATEALLTATEEGVELPKTARHAIWRWWLACPTARRWRGADRLSRSVDPELADDALRVLRAHDAGDELRDLAADVLCGPNSARISDEVFLDLCDAVRTGPDASRLVRIIEAANRARGVAPEIIRTIRDRLVSSNVAEIREASIDVAAETAEPDLEFLAKVLADLDADVRAAAADRIAFDAPFPGVITLVSERLRIEQHPRARAAMLRALACLTDEWEPSPRRRRRRI